MSRGFRQAALDTPLIVGEVGDRERVRGLLKSMGVDTVMHFAAYTIVPESVREPLKYYRNNTGSTGTLLECCLEAQVRHFVFPPTAAVYGTPAEGFAAESTPTGPDQSIRHLQAHVGMDAPGRGARLLPALRGVALLQRGGLGYRRAHRPATPKRRC